MWYRLNADAKLVWTDYASSEYSAHNYYLLKYRTLVIFSLFSSKMEHYMNSTVYTVVQIILNMQNIQPADCSLDENMWIYPKHCKTSKLSAKSWNRAFILENLVSLVRVKIIHNPYWLIKFGNISLSLTFPRPSIKVGFAEFIFTSFMQISALNPKSRLFVARQAESWPG